MPQFFGAASIRESEQRFLVDAEEWTLQHGGERQVVLGE